MADGHHDIGLSWEWDSVLLLTHPSLEPDASNSSGLQEPSGSITILPSDHRHHQHDKLYSHETPTTRIHTDSYSSETQQKGSSNGEGRRDPRLDCPNFLAGRVPCACTDNDDDDSGVSRKRSKPPPRCQVTACSAELTDLKGYHQRHRVCLRCAHATRVILRGLPHRYCQQCGKFHPICDFDEGKRSCRRKLERHNNRRRRKAGEDSLLGFDSGDTDTQNESSPGYGTSRLSKLDVGGEGHPNTSLGEKQSLDTETILQTITLFDEQPHALLEISEVPTTADTDNILEPSVSTTLEENITVSEPSDSSTDAPESLERQFGQEQTGSEQVTLNVEPQQESCEIMFSNDFSSQSRACPESEGAQTMTGNDEESLLALLMGSNGEPEDSLLTGNTGRELSSNVTHPWSQSPRLSKEVGYSPPLPTGRISFKLYDWNPGDFPRQLRQQVMEWLSNMPVDLEGYIRSGCTILTIFIAMPRPRWDELRADWVGSVLELIRADKSLLRFWSSGYLIACMDDHVVHINNGKLVRPRSLGSVALAETPVLHRVRPLCVEAGCEEEVAIFGQNFQQPHSRLLVSFNGKYVINDASWSNIQGASNSTIAWIHEAGSVKDLKLLVSIPALPRTYGTAYIEVEHMGRTSNYIPLLVAEKGIAEEVRSLEKEMDKPTTCCSTTVDGTSNLLDISQNGAHSLLLDLGWVLKNMSLTNMDTDSSIEIFKLYLERLRRLLFFGINRSWCNVVEKVLQLARRQGLMEKIGVLDNGLSALQVAVLHQKLTMVEHLLSCTESRHSGDPNPQWWSLDFPGPKGLTTLHMVAMLARNQSLLDTLFKRENTSVMWSCLRDESGWTPEDYATGGRKMSWEIDKSGLFSHKDGTTESQDHGGILRDLQDFKYENTSPSKFRDLMISIPVLPYSGRASAWKERIAGVTQRSFPVPFVRSGDDGLNMYIGKGRKRDFRHLSAVSVLLVCAGLCLVLQRPNQVILLSLSLRQCLWGLENGPK